MAGFDDNQPLRGPDFEPPHTDSRETLLKNENDPSAASSADTSEQKQIGLYQPSAPQTPPQEGGRRKISASLRNKIVAASATGVLGVGGLLGLGALPGVTVVNVKEVGVQYFGANVESVLDSRTNDVWVKKMNTSSKTAGVNNLCAKGISVGCRFSGMSDKEINKLTERAKKAGVDIEVTKSGKKNILGKNSISEVTVDGKTMSAKEFASEIRKTNSPTRKAMQSMMKSRFSVWTGAKINSLMSKLGISKAKSVSTAGSVDEAKEKIKQNQQGTEIDTKERLAISDDDSDEKKAEKNRDNTNADTVEKQKSNNLGDRVRTNALKNLGSATQDTVTKMAGSVAKGVLITGYIDSACTVVNTISAIGYMAKAVGALQLIRFAMTISNTADAIKAGEATNESIQAIGEMLTSVSKLDGLTAFDSYGWNWIAYGLLGDPTDTAEFKVGGGLPGDMTSFANKVKELAGGGEICNFIQNPGVRVGSALIGIVAAVFSGGTITTAQVVANVALAGGLSLIQAFSMPLIADMVAGEFVNDTTIGNSAGNAYVSGLGALYAQNNNATGLSALTVDAAVEFNKSVKATYLAQVKEESVNESGQFDATNPNSFLGSLTTQLASTINSRSAADASSKLIALVTNPTAKTASASNDDPAAPYKVCTDDEYTQLNIATDPFCNPVYGLSNTAIAMDPDDVIVYMYEHKYIDDNGSPIGKYSEFVSQCIENINPYGLANGAKNEDTDGKIKPKECLMSAGVYDEEFWVYTIDSNIYEKMQCLLEDDAVACGSAIASDTTTANGTCPAETSAIPEITTGWEDGKEKSITLCAIPDLARTPVQADSEFVKAIYGGLAANNISSHAVNALAAPSLLQIIQTAKEKGVTIGATFSYRSYNEQKAIRAIKTLDSNGNLTSSTLPGSYSSERAEAGKSNHQMGLSLDFDETSTRWMKICIAQNLDGTDDGRCYGWYDDVGPKDPKHFTYKPK